MILFPELSFPTSGYILSWTVWARDVGDLNLQVSTNSLSVCLGHLDKQITKGAPWLTYEGVTWVHCDFKMGSKFFHPHCPAITDILNSRYLEVILLPFAVLMTQHSSPVSYDMSFVTSMSDQLPNFVIVIANECRIMMSCDTSIYTIAL